MSFFQWLREGVRQAVVLGLADAVEDVGTRGRSWPCLGTIPTGSADRTEGSHAHRSRFAIAEWSSAFGSID